MYAPNSSIHLPGKPVPPSVMHPMKTKLLGWIMCDKRAGWLILEPWDDTEKPSPLFSFQIISPCYINFRFFLFLRPVVEPPYEILTEHNFLPKWWLLMGFLSGNKYTMGSRPSSSVKLMLLNTLKVLLRSTIQMLHVVMCVHFLPVDALTE